VADIVVLGGGVCGLAAGMLLARDGHEVTLLERDAAPVPESPAEAWEQWDRGGVSQFRLAHFLHPRATELIAKEFPEIRAQMIAADAAVVDNIARLPDAITGPRRPEDDRLVTLTTRRTTIEQIFGSAAEAERGLDVRRGVAVEGLLSGPGAGVPHVTGVRLAGGEELRADLVVDATGRRSPLPKWLAEIGCGPVVEEAEDSGFIYYGRFFRAPDGGSVPEAIGPLVAPIGSFSILTLPSDQSTWSVTLFIASRDQPLKVLRHADAWTALVKACPLHAHWLDGEPISDVVAMGGVLDRYRRFFTDGGPVATGVAAVADAWACTNPSLGRGISLGLMHAARLRDVVREELDDPLEFADAWDHMTERELAPWYRSTVATDRARLAEIEALRNGLEPPGPSDFKSGLGAELFRTMACAPDLLRAGLEITGCLALPEDVFARPGVVDRVVELSEAHPPTPLPGPSREELLRLVAEPAGA
jgi:2-polyprenyl-6-methoxyphenol hydroxylase-like FAD-dependent oxidoreductase